MVEMMDEEGGGREGEWGEMKEEGQGGVGAGVGHRMTQHMSQHGWRLTH